MYPRFAIPRVWANTGAQIFQLKNRFFPSSDIRSASALKIFQLKSSILSALVTSLDWKNLHACVCPNPGDSKPSISIMLDVSISATFFQTLKLVSRYSTSIRIRGPTYVTTMQLTIHIRLKNTLTSISFK